MSGLGLDWREVVAVPEWSAVVEPVDPFGGGDLEVVEALPWPARLDQLGLVGEAEAQLLASRGYPTLALAHFDAPGLTRQLRRIPNEYFERALHWVSRRPGVDPDHVIAYGVSRGSEVALLVASLAPDVAGGAIGFAPNGVALGAVPDTFDPAWTWQGDPVPRARTRREWWDDPGDAVIDVWDIDGPILLVCGAIDSQWSSSSQSEDVAAELADRNPPAPTVVELEDAGHEIGFAVRAPEAQGRTWMVGTRRPPVWAAPGRGRRSRTTSPPCSRISLGAGGFRRRSLRHPHPLGTMPSSAVVPRPASTCRSHRAARAGAPDRVAVPAWARGGPWSRWGHSPAPGVAATRARGRPTGTRPPPQPPRRPVPNGRRW